MADSKVKSEGEKNTTAAFTDSKVKPEAEKTAIATATTTTTTTAATTLNATADNSEKETAEMKSLAEAKERIESEEAKKAEELWDKKLKEIQASVQRFAPHNVPDREKLQPKENYAWHLRIYPIDQEDCSNCILEAAAKIAKKTFYYIPRRRNGYGVAELHIASDKDALSVMARLVRTTFYHRFVTIELTRFSQEKKKDSTKKPEETATVVFDTTRCEKVRNTVVSKEGQKSLWVRYLSENTSPEFLRVLFPLSQSAQVQTHNGLHFGLIEANCKADLLVFMKTYLTVIINNTNIWSLHTKEPGEKENAVKAEIDKVVQALGEPRPAPLEPADKFAQRREDKSEISRILKRTLHQQQALDQPPNKRGRMDLPAQRGIGGNWNWSGMNQFAGGVGTVGGHGGFGAQLNPRGITEMVMMQARLNQLMMLNPGARRGFNNSGFGGGRFGGASGGVRGGQKGFGRGW